MKNLLVVGYKNTNGVTMKPNLTHSGGRLNKTPKLIVISPARNPPAYFGDNSPVVRGLALVDPADVLIDKAIVGLLNLRFVCLIYLLVFLPH